jgi:hypothetical protein
MIEKRDSIKSIKTLKHETGEGTTMPKKRRRRVRFKTKHGWVEFYVED